MKRTNRLLLLFSAFVLTLSCGKKGRDTGPASVEWQPVIGGAVDEKAYAAVRGSDGGYVVVGYSSSTNSGEIPGTHGANDGLIVKLDAKGARQWVKLYGGSQPDEISAIAAAPDRGYIVAGYTFSSDGDIAGTDKRSAADFWIMKIDVNGAIQWSKAYGSPFWEDKANTVIVTSDGGCLVAGHSKGNGGDVSGNHGLASDFWVIKLDAAGNKQWARAYGGSDVDDAFSITACPDGAFAIAGTAASVDGDLTGNERGLDVWVVKIDGSGNILWNKRYGGSGHERGYSIKSTPDGGFIVAGNTSSNDGDVTGNHGHYDAWVVKLDASGNKQWAKTFGGYDDEDVYTVLLSSDGGYVLGGSASSYDGDITRPSGQGSDYWLVKLNATGELESSKCYNRSIYDWGLSLVSTDDNGYLFTGFTQDKNVEKDRYGVWDMWVLKVKPF